MSNQTDVEKLLAYLQGELGAEESKALESRLVEEESLRRQLVELSIEEAELEQVGFVHVLDGTLVFADRHGNRLHPDRSAATTRHDVQDASIVGIESEFIDSEPP